MAEIIFRVVLFYSFIFLVRNSLKITLTEWSILINIIIIILFILCVYFLWGKKAIMTLEVCINHTHI